MTKKFVVLLVMCVFLFAGCYAPNTVAATGFYDGYNIVSRNVPYADTTFEAQFDKVKKLEEDVYGRRYYSYETYSTSLKTQIEIHVICQKAEDQRAYYYEDYCYMIRKEDEAPFSESAVAQLKERNDWGKSLNQEKMREVPFGLPSISVGKYEECKTAILNHLGFQGDYGACGHGLEIDESGKQVVFFYIFSLAENKFDGKFEGFYLTVCQGERDCVEVLVCEEVEPVVNCQDVVSDFKSRHLGS